MSRLRSWPWDRKAPGSNPDFTDDLPCVLHAKSYAYVLSLVWCDITHPDPAYPTEFKALRSRRGSMLTSCSRRTQAPVAFIKSFYSHPHTTPSNMGGN
ncbi:hypothetical protein AVEN_241172-1 [Araneus ventricosus]|uniref:Uncharacterized protein n=1 Tax=Araneus ventricosus TaxID=182803 RepID=A0A4Y2G014_ARAVE|nr:hypothetical protein AVEN_241172-1 [Araneus ventricosus]